MKAAHTYTHTEPKTLAIPIKGAHTEPKPLDKNHKTVHTEPKETSIESIKESDFQTISRLDTTPRR